MDITTMSLRDMRFIYHTLNGKMFDNPQLTSIVELLESLKAKILAHPDYQKGLEYLKTANKESGIDSGYARAEDYYFTIDHQTIEYRGRTHKHVELVLCFKWNWWFNGQTFLPHKDGRSCRNFRVFVTPEMNDRWDENEEYTDKPEELRAQLISVGMEDFPALLPVYREYIKATHSKFDERRKPWREEDEVN